MTNGASNAEADAKHPAATVAWALGQVAKTNDLKERFPAGVPDDLMDANVEESVRAFDAIYEGLTDAERQAEADWFNRALVADPKGTFLAARLWNTAVSAWAAQRMQERTTAERRASDLADRALWHCAYLGGLPEWPSKAMTASFTCLIRPDGALAWSDRQGHRVAAVDWPDVQEIRVGPTDRGQERVTASRVALIGIFSLAAKKQRREAMLGVRTRDGDGIFIVAGYPPLELQAQLAPLIACIGQPTSDDYLAQVQDPGIDADLLRQAHERLRG